VRQLASALDDLPAREAAVLVLRFGISPETPDSNERTRREVSQLVQRSHSHIATLERTGLALLRQAVLSAAFLSIIEGGPLPPV
jgi:DNA-directed RNA polymerase specialized sigma subunit